MAMMFPLAPQEVFGHGAGQVLGVLAGMAFGAVLERAGFGQAANLAAQFYGRDNRVLKVMFTAIATTAASLGLLSAAGLLDLSLLSFPETYVAPEIVGGLLLGVGFAVAGYCPGTGVVAAASGSIDGLVAYLGVVLGTIVFGLAWPFVGGFYESGHWGAVRLDQLVDQPFHVVALAVVGIAVAAFAAVEALERFLAARDHAAPPEGTPGARNASLAAVALTAVGAVLVGLAPAEEAAAQRATVGAIDAGTLARRLIDDPRGVWIVDLRDRAACTAASVPGALCRPPDATDAAFVGDLPGGRDLVVVTATGGDVPDLTYDGPIVALQGGYPAFAAAVLTKPELPAEPSLADVEAFARASALHGHFTGASAPAAAPVVVKKAPAGPAVKKGGGC